MGGVYGHPTTAMHDTSTPSYSAPEVSCVSLPSSCSSGGHIRVRFFAAEAVASCFTPRCPLFYASEAVALRRTHGIFDGPFQPISPWPIIEVTRTVAWVTPKYSHLPVFAHTHTVFSSDWFLSASIEYKATCTSLWQMVELRSEPWWARTWRFVSCGNGYYVCSSLMSAE